MKCVDASPTWKPVAWRTVAPLALVSSSISSSRSVARRSAISAMIRERSSGVLPDQTPARNARLADSTAWSASTTVPLATVATISSVAGLRIS